MEKEEESDRIVGYGEKILNITASCFLFICLTLVFPILLYAESILTWHYRNPIPQGNPLRGVSYGGGVYLAVGDGGTVVSSPDGINWNLLNSGVNEDIIGIAYGKGIFVAVTRGDYYTGSKILVSSNCGNTWTSIDKGGYNLQDVTFISGGTFGDGIFIVSGRDNGNGKAAIITATNPSLNDGWVAQNNVQSVTDTSLLHKVVGGVTQSGEIVIVGVGAGGTIVTSSNGIDWVKVSSVSGEDLLDVAYGGGIFVAVGVNGKVLSSPDGTNWNPNDIGTLGTVRGVAYGGGRFISVLEKGKVATSTDGKSWTSKGSGVFNDLFSVCYGTQFVAVGENGAILTSPDGITWTVRSGDVLGNMYYRTLRGIVFADGLFVAVGDVGTILTSPDGVKWTKRYTLTDKNLYGISYGEGRFVAVGDKGTILTSTDGIEWVERYSGVENNLRGVTFGKGIFVAVGEKGSDDLRYAAILTSVDGTTWSAQNSGVSMDLQDIAYGSGIFAAIGTGGQTLVLTSNDGVGWTKKDTSGYVGFNSIVYGDGRFIGVGFYGKWMGSTNGIDWPISNLNVDLRSILYINQTFLAVGGTGNDENVFYPEGQTWKTIKTGIPAVLYGVAFGNDTFVAVGTNGTIIQSDRFPYAPLHPAAFEVNVPPHTISENSATITWKTQTPTVGQIEYRREGTDVWKTAMELSQRTEHSVTIDMLTPDTVYYFRIIGLDKNGKTTKSAEYSFMTVPVHYVLTITKKGSGTAEIFAEGLSCNDLGCKGSYSRGRRVEIKLSPRIDSTILFWTEECRGAKDTCTVSMDSDINLTVLLGKVRIPNGEPLNTWVFRNPVPQGNTINALSFGGDIFVAVGDYGTILTSPDGNGWTKRYADTTENLVGVGYGNGLFVAVDRKGAIIISPDGIKWTKILEGKESIYLSYAPVAYGNGLFVVQTYKAYLVSTNGIDWITTSGSTQFIDMIFCNGLFVGGTGSEYGGNAVIQVSPDGINWFPRSPKTGYTITALACGGDNIFAVSRVGNISISSDGVEWTVKNSGTSLYSLSDVVYGNGLYVAVGGNGLILTSTDASNWVKVETGSSSYFKNVAFGNNRFVVTGNNGATLYSTNGVSWNALNKGDNGWITGIAYGNGVYVAVGDGIISSHDRKNWTKRASGTFYGISFVNNRFVAVGHYDLLLTSNDGIDWKTQNIPKNSANLYGVAFGKYRYVAVGGTNTGIIITSSDASAWSNVDMGQQNVLSLFGFSGVAYGEDGAGNGRFVAVGNGWDGEKWSGIIFTSNDGLKWTLKEYGHYNAFHDVIYVDNAFYVIGGVILRTTDLGESWQKISDYGGYGLGYGNNTLIATGDSGTIYTSTDRGLTWNTYRLPTGLSLTKAVFGDGRWLVVGENGTIMESLSTTSISGMVLSKGWNFLSFPLLPAESIKVEEMLSGYMPAVRLVWGYDNRSKEWQLWKLNNQSQMFKILNTLESGKGYWVYMDSPSVLDISNWNEGPRRISLSPGWNLVGWNGENGKSVKDALSSLNDWIILWGWDNGVWKAKQINQNVTINVTPLEILQNGKAYWIWMGKGGDWEE